MTPAAQAEAYYTQQERERIAKAKAARCIESAVLRGHGS